MDSPRTLDHRHRMPRPDACGTMIGCAAAAAAVAVASIASWNAAEGGRLDDEAAPPPLRLGFEDETVGERGRQSWFVPAEGWKAEVVEGAAPSGARYLKLHVPGATGAPFGNVMAHFDAAPYRGSRVALRSKMRVEGAGRGQMWLRVDCADGRMGAFDNMDNRPIVGEVDGADPNWRPATIELDIDDDARWINIGWMSIGGRATVMVDDAEMVVVGQAATRQPPSPPKALDARGLENVRAAAKLLGYVRFFHPSDEAVAVKDWGRVAIELVEAAEPARDGADLAGRLAGAITGIAPTVQIWAGSADDAPPLPTAPAGARELVSWRHVGIGRLHGSSQGMGPYSSAVQRAAVASPVDPAIHAESFVVKALGGGVSCRVPIRVYADEQGTIPHAAMNGARGVAGAAGAAGEAGAARAADAEPPVRREILSALNRSTRLAAVALGWGVFQHFYPYFDVVETDWDAALTAALAGAAEDADERRFERTLQALVARLHDGHGAVYRSSRERRLAMPLAFEWAGDDPVVVGRGTDAPAEVAVGDAVTLIDGRPIADWIGERSPRISAATEGSRRFALASTLQFDPLDGAAAEGVDLRFRRPGGDEYAARVPVRNAMAKVEPAIQRPANGAEIAPGVVYFDLDGTGADALTDAMPKLEAARGLVFDLRGYPGDAARLLISHLVDTMATSARWNVPVATRPDREGVTWNQSGRWMLMPKAPRLRQPVAFLTDGRAISYAESIMGIVEAYRLGEIVGSTTAGTNGNVNPFELPGGYRVSWTGMKVLKHDGSQHHGVGIAPTAPVAPTAKGIAAGRDEVLEKAIEVVRAKIDGGG